MAAVEEIRGLELVQFERGGNHVLFHPETLSTFRLNESAARLVHDVLQGMDEAHLAEKHDTTPIQLERSLAPIVETVRKRDRAVSKQASSSWLKEKGKLPKAVLMVNNYCNLKCTYCYEHKTVFTKKAIDMPLLLVRTAIDKIYAAYDWVETWMFIGGEPTLCDDVIEFACRYACAVAERKGAKRPGFGMVCNGVKMSERFFAIAREFEIQITFSIDGPKKIHDLVRIRHDNSGSFDAVAGNIHKYRNMLPDKTLVECTLTQAHWDAGLSIPEVLQFCAEGLGVDEPHIAMAGLPKGDPLSPYRTPELRENFLKAAEVSMDHLLEGKGAGGRGGKLDMVVDMTRRLLKKEPNALMCPAGIEQVVVDAFGDVYPCWMFAGTGEHAMGNILRDELRGPKALRVIGRIEQNSKWRNPYCSTCYARGVCNSCVGNNHNSSGRLEEPSPQFCETVRGTLRVVLERLAREPRKQSGLTQDFINGKTGLC